MVYCGKPSRGCQNCKTRRIKCDEARPTCGQCRKSSRVCPGYPDEFDLIFRNETSAVKKRAEKASSAPSASSSLSKRKQPSGKASQSSRTSASPSETSLLWDTAATTTDGSPKSDNTDEESSALVSSQELISTRSSPWSYESYSPSDLLSLDLLHTEDDAFFYSSPEFGASPSFNAADLVSWHPIPSSLSLSPEINAVAFFIKNFAMAPRQRESERGYLEALLPMYNNAADGSVLQKATQAVALATLGNSHKSPSLRVEAYQTYGQALRQVSGLIRDPVAAKSDELLMSILLFSLYEAIAGTVETQALWTQHVNGAITLAKLRGKEQLKKSPQSLHLFRAVRASMLTSSIVQNRGVDHFPGSKGWACDEDLDPNAANRLTLICLKLPDMKRYAKELFAKESTLDTVNEVRNLIRAAKDIDSQLENWALTLPQDWEYHTAEICKDVPETSEETARAHLWPGPVHVYHDLSVASIWNDYRVSRIFCQAVILGCTDALQKGSQAQQTDRIAASAAYIIQEMVDDFCSSLPFLFGYDAEQRTKVTGQDEISLKMTGAYFAIWPLFVTKTLPSIPARQKEWLEGRLNVLGHMFGLNRSEIVTLAKRHVLTSGPAFGYDA